MIPLRDPYAWLSSIAFLPYGGCPIERNFSAFLRRPFATFGACKPWRVRPTPMAVWNELARAARQLDWCPAVVLREETMLMERRLVLKLRKMNSLLGLPDRNFSLPAQLPPVRWGLKPWTPAHYAAERRKYRRRPWRRRYSLEDLAWVNAHLSDEAMVGFERVHS